MNSSRKKKGSRGARRGGRQRVRSAASNLQPSQLVPTMKLSHVFRFTSGAGTYGGGGITRAQLLNLLLYTPTATTSVRLFEAVRLRRVQVWTNPPVLGGSPVSCSVEWLGENSPSTLVSDQSMGVRPAYIDTRPPANASNRWWSISGFSESDVLFILTAPPNSIIDVMVDVRLVEAEAPTAGDVPAAATIGQLYCNYLDGIITHILAPIGYQVLP